jgi:hypothetical protein
MRPGLSALGALLAASIAHAQMPSDEPVRVSETAHFRCLYEPALAPLVPQLLADCEEAHARLSPVFRWTPAGKTTVLFADDTDLHNGWATPVPRPTMKILASAPPVKSSIFDAGPYLRRTVFHEYAHILVTDAQYGADAALAGLFGRVLPLMADPLSLTLTFFSLPPSLFAPSWFHEGISTWVETEFAGPGRGRNTVADMVLRVAAAEGRSLDPSEWNENLPDWPYGQAVYLYGLKAMQYAEESYGLKANSVRAVPAELSDSMAHSFACFVNRTARPVTGEWLGELARNASRRERTRQEQRLARLKEEPLTPLTRLTPRDVQVERPAFGPDGTIWFIGQPADARGSLYRFDPRTASLAGADRARLEYGRGSRPAVAPDGKVYFTRLIPAGRDRMWSRLHVLGADGRVSAVPPDSRCRYPAVNRDGSRVAVVWVEAGRQFLACRPVGYGGAIPYESRPAPEGRQLVDPVWHPDGVRVLYVTAEANRWQLRMCMTDAEDRLVFEWPHAILSPAMHPDGDQVVFSSDRTGVYNLYRIRLSDTHAAPEALTHVIGGLFDPAFSGDGRTLAAVGFDSCGSFLTTFAYDDLRPRARLPPALEPAWTAMGPTGATGHVAGVAPSAPVPYRSLGGTRMDFWSPWLTADSGGAAGGLTAWFSDPSGYQSGGLVAGAESEYGEWIGSAVWQYRGVYPILTVTADREVRRYANLLEDVRGNRFDHAEAVWSAGIGVGVEHPGPDTIRRLAVGWRIGGRDSLDDADVPAALRVGLPAFEGSESGVWVSLLLFTGTAFPRSHSVEDGGLFRLAAERLGSGGSDVVRPAGRADLDWYLCCPWAAHHVVKLSGAGAASRGDEWAQAAFGLGGYASAPDLGGAAGVERDFSLRGYLANTQVGDSAVRAAFAYRFPIAGVYRGGPVSALYYHQFFGEVFYEGGRTWGGASVRDDGRGWLRAAGAEINASITLFRMLDIAPGLGVAYAFDRESREEGGDDDSRLSSYLSVKAVVNF